MLGDERRGARLLLAQFRMLMDVAPPGDQFLLDRRRALADLLFENSARSTCARAGAEMISAASAPAQRSSKLRGRSRQEIRQRAAAIEEKLIAWRRDIHEHPELASRRRAPRRSSPSI